MIKVTIYFGFFNQDRRLSTLYVAIRNPDPLYTGVYVRGRGADFVSLPKDVTKD